MKIATKSYDIFVYEKNSMKGPTPEDLFETAELTRKFVKFLRESKFKIPKFLSNVEKMGNSYVIGQGDSAQEVVSAKDRIKSYGGDKSMAFVKCVFEGRSQLLDEFAKEGADIELKGSLSLRNCSKCNAVTSSTNRVCLDCGGTLIEFTTKLIRVNGFLIADYPYSKRKSGF